MMPATSPMPTTYGTFGHAWPGTRLDKSRVVQARQPKIISVASGKGGVGKTWFSITAAHLLARSGRRVLLFDGDLGLANVDIQLGVLPERDLGSLVTKGLPLGDAVTPYAPDRSHGFDILAGRSGAGLLASLDAMSLERLIGTLRHAADYDTILLDLGAGVDAAMRRLTASADLSLVLATDEPTSLTDAYAVLKLLERDHRQLRTMGALDARVVINQAGTLASGEKTYGILARACRTFLGQEPPLAGAIRRDERVRDAIRHQTPLPVRHPDTPAVRDMQRLINGLVAE